MNSFYSPWGLKYSTMGSNFASVLFIFGTVSSFCPPEVKKFIAKAIIRIKAFLYPYIQISIHEFIGSNMKSHEAYSIIEAYLSETSAKTAKRLKAELVRKTNKFVFSMNEYEKVSDEFQWHQDLVDFRDIDFVE
ncbi:hypothetical protein LIER_33980 [Lithospermum erythrorhizon]|uniref:AAA-type ATPase N-terminal domain-containing protein n=1 Tax=Lithospermum erythrorhizon TaxID=34254 RepID=A0AAV3S1Z4_LITER